MWFCRYYSIIDLKILICLKYFIGEKNDFLLLENESLIDINLLSNFNIGSKDIEIKIIDKIMHLPKLKNLNFSLYFTSDNDISKIQGD